MKERGMVTGGAAGGTNSGGSFVSEVKKRGFVILLIMVTLFVFFYTVDPGFEGCAAFVGVLSFSCCVILVTVKMTFPLVANNISLSVNAKLMYCSLINKCLVIRGKVPAVINVLTTVVLKVLVNILGNMLMTVVSLPTFLTALYAYVVAHKLNSVVMNKFKVS